MPKTSKSTRTFRKMKSRMSLRPGLDAMVGSKNTNRLVGGAGALAVLGMLASVIGEGETPDSANVEMPGFGAELADRDEQLRQMEKTMAGAVGVAPPIRGVHYGTGVPEELDRLLDEQDRQMLSMNSVRIPKSLRQQLAERGIY